MCLLTLSIVLVSWKRKSTSSVTRLDRGRRNKRIDKIHFRSTVLAGNEGMSACELQGLSPYARDWGEMKIAKSLNERERERERDLLYP